MSCKIKNDLSELKLIGKVKTLTETANGFDKHGELRKVHLPSKLDLFFHNKENKIEKTEYRIGDEDIKTIYYKFNEEGNIIEKTQHRKEEDTFKTIYFKYDDNGNVIESYTYKINDGYNFKYTYKYDDKGNKIEIIGNDSKGMYYKWCFKFNEKGHKIEWKTYLSDGSLDRSIKCDESDNENEIEVTWYESFGNYDYYKLIFKYDNKGNKIEEKWYQIGGFLESSSKYDDNGKQLDYGSFGINSNLSPKPFKYDDHGNMIMIDVNSENTDNKRWHNLAGVLERRFKFDIYGNQIEWDLYRLLDGSLRSKHNYKYNDQGYLIEENAYESDGSLNFKNTCKYDDKGNKIENYYYSSANVIESICTFKYNDNGSMIEKKLCNSKGGIICKWIFKYDRKGNLIKTKYHSNDKYKYEYDKIGNWFKLTAFEDGVLNFIIERKIEYY